MKSPNVPDATTTALRVLIVEDVDHKFEEVHAALQEIIERPLEVARAKTVVEAEDHLIDGGWGLVVLDISMDIAPGSSGPMREGHANLGGLDIIEQMYLLDKEAPTVIVTGFDYFVSASADGDTREAQTFSDLERQARSWIGAHLLGCVRYGTPSWQAALSKIIASSFK